VVAVVPEEDAVGFDEGEAADWSWEDVGHDGPPTLFFRDDEAVETTRLVRANPSTRNAAVENSTRSRLEITFAMELLVSEGIIVVSGAVEEDD
jgi:hypothetical protein